MKLVGLIEHKIPKNDSRITTNLDTIIKFFLYEDENKNRKVEWNVTGQTYHYLDHELGRKELNERVELCDLYQDHILLWLRGIDDKIIMKNYFSYKQKSWYKKLKLTIRF